LLVILQGIGQWACAEEGGVPVVDHVVVATMEEDMDIQEGDAATYTQTTNLNKKGYLLFHSDKQMNGDGEGRAFMALFVV
ncbi:hypothetical protein E2562_016491, partial [Oryza meyeriana var. granulata]